MVGSPREEDSDLDGDRKEDGEHYCDVGDRTNSWSPWAHCSLEDTRGTLAAPGPQVPCVSPLLNPPVNQGKEEGLGGYSKE